MRTCFPGVLMQNAPKHKFLSVCLLRVSFKSIVELCPPECAKFSMKYNNYVFLNKVELVLVESGKLAFDCYNKHYVPFLFLVQLRFIYTGTGNLSKLIQWKCWLCIRETADSEL